MFRRFATASFVSKVLGCAATLIAGVLVVVLATGVPQADPVNASGGPTMTSTGVSTPISPSTVTSTTVSTASNTAPAPSATTTTTARPSETTSSRRPVSPPVAANTAAQPAAPWFA